jgi:EAL domain-containing protein (putative c-di-GMP-specific phosphodiesterase class I)
MPLNPLSGFLSAGNAPEGRTPIDAILDAVRHHLGMEIAFASRYVGDRREFTHISTDLPLPHRPGDGDPVEESFCWHILHGRLPELIHNAADLPFAQSLPITNAMPVGCHMDIPLRLKDGSVYGSFCCLSREADYSLTDRDLATMRAFAELAMEQIELGKSADDETRLVADRIDAAVKAGQPRILLQPIHRLDDGVPVGAEALARFEDAEQRPPNLWFEDAARLGRGADLELAAIRNALATLPFIPAGKYLTVNVSPETAISGALEPLLEPVAGRDIVVEVTEHSQVDDYAALRAALKAIRRYARIAIDDVGAGYSGLRHIVSLEPDILKLDMSLTRNIDRDPARRALAIAMVSFAAQIGSVIVAEGIERPEERAVLRELGISHGQGWHFSRAMPVVAAQLLLLGAANDPERRRARRGAVKSERVA